MKSKNNLFLLCNAPKIFIPLDGDAVSLGAFLGAVFVAVSFSWEASEFE